MIHIYLTIINNILTNILIVLLLIINILTDIFNVIPRSRISQDTEETRPNTAYKTKEDVVRGTTGSATIGGLPLTILGRTAEDVLFRHYGWRQKMK
jgi:hypothetical protein